MDDLATTELKKKADQFESQYNKLKKEFKDYIEISRKNEDLKKKELQSDAAKKMLVFADSLSRMSGAINTDSCDVVNRTSENFQKNIDVMYQQLLSVAGLTPVNPAPGEKFDDTLHMAIGLEYGSRYPEDTVYRVIRKGYLRDKTLIRPAEVIISKRPREEIKAKQPGIWNYFTSRLFPAHHQLIQFNQQIDALEHARSETTILLEAEITCIKECLSQSVAEKQETDQLIQEQMETIERLEAEMENLKDCISSSVVKSPDTELPITDNPFSPPEPDDYYSEPDANEISERPDADLPTTDNPRSPPEPDDYYSEPDGNEISERPDTILPVMSDPATPNNTEDAIPREGKPVPDTGNRESTTMNCEPGNT